MKKLLLFLICIGCASVTFGQSNFPNLVELNKTASGEFKINIINGEPIGDPDPAHITLIGAEKGEIYDFSFTITSEEIKTCKQFAIKSNMDNWNWNSVWANDGIGSVYTDKISIEYSTDDSEPAMFIVTPGNNWTINNSLVNGTLAYNISLTVTKQEKLIPRGVILYDGIYSCGSWSQAAILGSGWNSNDYVYNGFKPEWMVKNCEFYVFFNGKDHPLLVIQEPWTEIKPSIVSDGIAKFTYEDIANSYNEDWSQLGAISVRSQGSDLTTTKMLFYSPTYTNIDNNIVADKEIVAKKYFTVSGIEIGSAQKGINIVKEIFSDGSESIGKLYIE